MVFAHPNEGEKFKQRNEVFFRFWPRLEVLLNRAFARRFEVKNVEEEVVFGLGRIAVEDFLELLLLAGNGYGFGALKLLRSCYELTITCGYLSKHPEMVRPFLEYHHVSERRAMNHFKNLYVEPRMFLSEEKIAEIERNFERVKAQFMEGICERCGTTRVQRSWTKLDMASLARDIGVGASYPMMYFWPTMQSHPTTYLLTSRFKGRSGGAFEQGPQPQQADTALAGASVLMAMLLEFQDRFFNLGLGEELIALRTEYTQALQAAAPQGSGG